jgi:hypothetical protein
VYVDPIDRYIKKNVNISNLNKLFKGQTMKKIMKIKSQPKTHKLKAGVPLALEKTKKVKINTRCPHKEMKHYAKGMCNHCYHVYGRKKMAYSCPHTDLLVYARGMC